jgi:hypothetical protein
MSPMLSYIDLLTSKCRLFAPATTNLLVGLLMARQTSGLSPRKATPPVSPMKTVSLSEKNAKTPGGKPPKAAPKSRKRPKPEVEDDNLASAPAAKRPKASKTKCSTGTPKENTADIAASKVTKPRKLKADTKSVERKGKKGSNTIDQFQTRGAQVFRGGCSQRQDP